MKRRMRCRQFYNYCIEILVYKQYLLEYKFDKKSLNAVDIIIPSFYFVIYLFMLIHC